MNRLDAVAYLGQGLGGLRMENPGGGLGGAVSPPAGSGAAARKILKILHFIKAKINGI